ncbi:MAG: cell filamentation protein Fic, partial [Bacteroidia bacterium]|nr:cell filamentation protein Fic [Bacteroidia bacterium]
MEILVSDNRFAGYSYLIEKLGIVSIPNWHRSTVSSTGTHFSKIEDGFVDEMFRNQYWPGETISDHLEFAIKYDGVNLTLLAQIFEKIPVEELIKYITSKPTGKYARRIWFFYEFLLGKHLPIDDMNSGNYINALETNEYFTIQNGERSTRHRVVNNLLGPRSFCPVVRKTEKLLELDSAAIQNRCEEIVKGYPPQLIRR